MKGSCHCGKISFETTGEPTWLGRCHCKDCQKISGTAFMAFAGFEKKNTEIIKGSPKEYKSSEHITRTFCEGCGSPIEWRDDRNPDKTNFTLGLFEDTGDLKVTKDIWEEHKVLW
jgi:hypothetical protein